MEASLAAGRRHRLGVRASYRVDGNSDVCMAELVPMKVFEGAGSSGHATSEELTGRRRIPMHDNEGHGRGAQRMNLPEANAPRTECVDMISRSRTGSIERGHAGQEQEVWVAAAFWRLGNYEACAVSACSRGRRYGASGVRGRAGHASEAWLRVRTAVRTKMVRVCACAESANLLCIGVTGSMPVVPVSCGYAAKKHVRSIQ